MGRSRARTAALLVCLLAAAPARAALTEAARLAHIYDAILDARFGDADAELARACPPAPAGACRALTAVSLWWQININPERRHLDARFTRAADAAIAENEAWTRRDPSNAEAWFYLAGSYAPLVQWRVLRGERLAAARDGKRIKDALERSLSLNRSLSDAHFGIGLYHYYADVAPLAAKFLRWLLLLPGGDRATGLAEMKETRDKGELLRGEADYQLQVLDLWYEHRTDDALGLLESLDRRYPHNPLFLQRIAEVRNEYEHDGPASTAAWETLLARARAGRVWQPAIAETRALLGSAAGLDAADDTDKAIDRLLAVRQARPTDPPPARARAELLLGLAYDRIGQRAEADAAYRSAVTLAPDDDADDIKGRARAAMRAAHDRAGAEAYRMSLDGWRAFEGGDATRALRLLGDAVTRAPRNHVARVRYARVLVAGGQIDRARVELEQVINATPQAPAIALAAAYVESGALLERAHERDRAREAFRIASAMRGGAIADRERAQRALQRLS